jgi:hypothetical protein
MAGVAGPMLRNKDRAGARFLAGLLVGEAAAGLLLAVPAYLLSEMAQVLPQAARLWILVGVCAIFGVADLMNRTPHVWRQVPQALIHRLQPGTLGVAWGFDLGLLFTTQKVVSLIWVAIAAGVLLQPAMAAGVVVGVAVLTGLAVIGGSVTFKPGRLRSPGALLRRVRQASGSATLALAVLTVAQAWHG